MALITDVNKLRHRLQWILGDNQVAAIESTVGAESKEKINSTKVSFYFICFRLKLIPHATTSIIIDFINQIMSITSLDTVTVFKWNKYMSSK